MIGTNEAGTAALANTIEGIYVAQPGGTIGGTSAGAANVISGNGTYGLYIGAACLVEGNLIGTNAAGTAALANLDDGIYVGGSGATIGGTTPGAGNVISGNGEVNVAIDAPCLVEGNLIGTNKAGSAALSIGMNSVYGISVNGSGATIGGTSAGAGNLISGNAVRCRYRCVVPDRGQPDRHQRGRYNRSRELQRGHLCQRPGRHDRRDLAGRRQSDFRQCRKRRRHRGILPDRGQPDRHQRRLARPRWLMPSMAFMSTSRAPRSGDLGRRG